MIEIIPNVHPIFVHFTVALLIIAAGIHLLSHFVSSSGLKTQMAIVARWNLWIGLGCTVLTVAAGWYAFYTVNHDTPSHLAMVEHRNWAMATFAVLLGIAGWEYYLQRYGKSKGWLFTGLLVIAASLLFSTAWHGGELVYRHGLGVMSLPITAGAGHDHTHDDAAHDEQGTVSGHTAPAAESAVSTPKKAAHTHLPGTPPHKD